MIKPKKCCGMGTHEHTVPMAIKGRRQDVDFCVAHIIAALNAANITTVNSCCGHGELFPTILLEDDKCLVIVNREQAIEIIKEYKGAKQ